MGLIRSKIRITNVLSISTTTTYPNSLCSCLRRRFHCQGHDVPKYGRTAEAPGGGAPLRRRPLRVLQMQLQRLSRHPIRLLPTPVLQGMRHLWNSRFHLWRCSCSPPKLQHICEEAHEWPKEFSDGPSPVRPQREHRNFDPQFTSHCRFGPPTGPGLDQDIPWQAMAEILKDFVHEDISR